MPNHADVARRSISRAVKEPRVEIRIGPAAETLRAMIAAREAPFDFIFIDADKPGYYEYLDLSMQLARSGTVIVADNLIRNGAVLDPETADDNARAIRVFNDALAAHPRLESIIVPIMREHIDGISISIVK
jgi:predicted O-methyltransferase YrrM